MRAPDADHAKPGVADPEAESPTVTLIVPARNEEAALPRALASFLALDYPDLEVILINDHSSDRTGAILDEYAARAGGRWSVIHDPPLPAGWMGKNNAVWTAAQRARGSWLLFTDADIVFAPDAIRRAVATALRAGNDIQPMMPFVELGTLAEHVVLPPLVMLGLGTFLSVRSSRDPARAHAMGVGAFTLVRAEPYLAAGGHAAIAGEVVEDVELARLMKRSGARYDLLDGTGLISVRMYTGLRSLFDGFRKNLYSGAGKRASISAVIALGTPLLMGGPALGIVIALVAALRAALHTGSVAAAAPWIAAGAVGLVALLAMAIATWATARCLCGARPLPQLLHALAGVVIAAIVAASTYDGAIRRRVLWRGRSVPIRGATETEKK